MKIILSLYYWGIHAFEKGVKHFLNWVHFYENNSIFILLRFHTFENVVYLFWKEGFTFMKNTK